MHYCHLFKNEKYGKVNFGFFFCFIFCRQNKWCAVSPMSTRRKHLGCAVFNNYIYAVGGRDDCMELSSAERYNPHTNTWSPIVAMTSRRSGVCTQSINFFFFFEIGKNLKLNFRFGIL